ncbi:MAG: hypothetical protein K2X04_11875 [Burkholderiales bacterium]|nr:hypothetical protein [Burkholderiales bacterium]
MFKYLLIEYLVPVSTLFSNVMVGLVPIIVGWMRYFSTNIKVLGQTSGYDKFYGESYSLKLENKTLRSFVIDKVNVFINQENFFTIDLEKLDFEKRALEPFKQLVIKEQWTEMLSDPAKKPILYGIKFEIFCGSKVILIKYLSFWQQLKHCKIFIRCSIKKDLMSIKNRLPFWTHRFDNNIISTEVKFALHLFNENGIFERTILIAEHGLMSDSFRGYNCLQRDCMKSVDLLEKHIKDELLKDSGYSFRIQAIER